MRVYELAAKIGTTSQTVMRLAEENEVEVYSPLSTLESDEVETLNAALLKVGVEKLKADAESARDRRMNKARRALKAAEEANRIQADELEANRQRAIAAYKEKGGDIPMPETKKAPVAAAKKPVKEEIKLDLPEGPKVKFEVSAAEPEEADATASNDADDFDDDDDDSWLQGKDRKAAGGKNQPMSMKKQQQALAKKEPKKEKEVKKDAKKEAAKPVDKSAPFSLYAAMAR